MIVPRQKRIFTSVRPARVAVFLYQDDPNWQSTCIRIIEFFSSAWGGGNNIIIPTNGKTILPVFSQVLDIFDADYFFFYYPSGLDVKLNEPEKYREWVEQELIHFIGSDAVSDVEPYRRQIDAALMRSQLVSQPPGELQLQLIRKFAPFHFEEHAFEAGIGAGSAPRYPLAPLNKLLPNIEHPTRIATYESKYAGVYPLWVASITGSLTTEFKTELETLGIRNEISAANDYGSMDLFLSPIQNMRLSQEQLVTPFELANIDTGLYQPVRAASWNMPIVLALGDTLSDFCLYYSLSRLRHRVVWLPLHFLRTQSETGGGRMLLDGYVDHLRDFARMSQIQRDPKYAIVSTSFDSFDSPIDELNRAGYGRSDNIGDSLSVAPEIPSLLEFPLRLYERDNTVRPTPLAISENAELDFFDTPKPKNLSRLDPYENRWITEVNIPAHQLPRHYRLGQWLVRHPTSLSNTARVGKAGISYFCPNSAYFGGDIDTTLVRPTITIPDAFEIFQHLFEREGYSSGTSDKGFFERDTIQKFGHLSALGTVLRTTPMREMLLKFLDHVKPPQGAQDEGAVLNDKRRYLNLPAITKFMLTGEAAKTGIELLVATQVLQRGFIFKCRYCRNADWFSLEEVSQNFKCKRCSRTQGITAKNYWYAENEPGFFYKLDEIVYQFLRNNGHVTALALDHLRRKAQESFLYTPDIELTKSGEVNACMELDLLCVADGVMTIGEAKKEDRLGSNNRQEIETIRAYDRVAAQISAEAIVFATFADKWSETTENNIRDNINGPKVILLTSSELLSAD